MEKNDINSIIENNLKQMQLLLLDCQDLLKMIDPESKITDGILCTKCGGDTKVIDHRYHKVNDEYIKMRRRECLICGYRYNTIEVPVERSK
jgi:hypothetical protein